MHQKKQLWSISAILLLALIFCLAISATAFAAVGNESFQKNLEQFPGLYSEDTGTTMPVFQYGSSNIMEEVYVECPLDTDDTGTRDLIRVTIRRPAESNLEGVRVPVLMQDSPYIDGGGVSAPNHSVTAFPFEINLDTGEFTYKNNIESVRPRASEWPWGDQATPTFGIPASRGEKPVAAATRVSSIYGTDFGSFANYMFVRGYATVSTDSIGNRYSDGYTSCGDVDETVAGMAVIKWLNGKCRAYKTQDCTEEVIATDWCNGNVAMSGVSYDGTLPVALACSGVEGLKAIIPASAISSWYDYYRENGGVSAPGGYQGEDADVLAKYCFSRGASSTTTVPSYTNYRNNVPNIFGVGLRDAFNLEMEQMFADQDRTSGDYSRFWDDRNYLATVDKVTAGIIVTHGLNDWNVKTKQFDQFYRAVKEKTDTPIKLVLFRGGHMGIYTYEPFFRNAHKWLDYYLYGIENGIVESMPELSLISSDTGKYEYFDSWPVSNDEYTRYYLNTDGDGAAGTLSLDIPASAQKSFTDLRNGAALTNWETRIIGASNLAAASSERIAFVADITENVRFSGTVKATLQVASDQPFGYLTAALVEIGPSRTFNTVTAETIAAHNGVSAINITRPNSVTTGSSTSYKVAALGHADIQNPNPKGEIYMDAADTNYIPEYYYRTVEITPGEFNSYTFEFEPNDWEFRAGNKMAIMVYSIDYRYTPTPAAPHIIPTLTLQLGAGSYVEIPALSNFNTLEPIHATLIVDGKVYLEYPVARGAALEEPVVPEMKPGYFFDGWRTGSEAGPRYDFNEPLNEDIQLFAAWYKPVPTAFVEKLNGNKNNLTVTVTEYHSDGIVESVTKTFSISNNAAGTYTVGGYSVYVDTKGNTQIRACEIVKYADGPIVPVAPLPVNVPVVEEPVVEEPVIEEPVIEEPVEEEDPFVEEDTVEAVLTGVKASAELFNKSELTIRVIESYSDGAQVVFAEKFSIKNNSEGTYNVGGYKVYVNIKGNAVQNVYLVD